MTPSELKQARQSLGLTQAQLAPLLGYRDKMRVSDIERGVKTPHGSVTRLLSAYLDGYRPKDWPNKVVGQFKIGAAVNRWRESDISALQVSDSDGKNASAAHRKGQLP